MWEADVEVAKSDHSVFPLAWASAPPSVNSCPASCATSHTTVLIRLMGFDLELPVVLALPPVLPAPGPWLTTCGGSGERGVSGVRGVRGEVGGGKGECGGGGGMEDRGGY